MASKVNEVNGNRVARHYEPQPGRDAHNGRIRSELFREIEEALDAAEQGNAYRKVRVEIDVSAGKFETGRVETTKTLK